MKADASSSRPGRIRMRRGVVRTARRRRVPDPPERVLVASPGIPFPHTTLRGAMALAAPKHARITVLSLAKVWGTSLGFPHPGLQPTRAEWDEQRTIVNDAAEVIRREGFDVRVQVARTRNPAKMIARWGLARNFHAVVIPGIEKPAWRRRLEGDLARDIERRTGIPVHEVWADGSVERARP